MAIWTTAQVSQVRGAYSVARLDGLARQDPGVLDAVHHELALKIVDIARSFAVEAHPHDCRFAEREGERDEVEVRAWWSPSTKRVEMLGGPGDGDLVDLAGAPDRPFFMPRPQSLPVQWLEAASPSSRPLEPNHLRYEMSGWREVERRWIYSLTR